MVSGTLQGSATLLGQKKGNCQPLTSAFLLVHTVTYRKREIFVCVITSCSAIVSQVFCTLFS